MARRPTADRVLEELREPIEKLAEGNERIIQTLNRLDGHMARGPVVGGDPLTRHMRRYMPFYVVALAWAFMLVLLPTVRNRVAGISTTTGPRSDIAGPATIEVAPGGEVSSPTTPSGRRTSGSGSRATLTAPRTTAESQQVAQSLVGTGVTRAGVVCQPGVRQIPWSEYAIQCSGKFDGDNGAATNRGVTKDQIKIIRRVSPDTANQAAIDTFVAQAGFASREVNTAVRNDFIKYFNSVYELYDRQVVIVDHSNNDHNQTNEAQGKDREQACRHAAEIANEKKAFGVAFATYWEQFSDCAAQQKLGVFTSNPYYAESYFRRGQPYLWHRVPQCELIGRQFAEYIGKRMAHKPAKWAGDPFFQRSIRKFGTYVPDNEGYQICVRLSQKILRDQYNVPQSSQEQFNYTLDVSRFPDMAAQGILRFKAANVTTVIFACDSISQVLLTQAAKQQQYYPEWFLIGVAATDTDNIGNLTDQEETVGHMFGMSQLGATEAIFAKDGEMARTYKAATGKEIPAGATGDYGEMLHIFNVLQGAGPGLDWNSVSTATQALPVSGLKISPFGRWYWGDTHTAVIDAREVYWVAPDKDNATSNGKFVVTYGGKRFTDDEWPVEDPPVYPGGKTSP